MHWHAQACAKARQRLRRQADFRHQNQRLLARVQTIADCLQIHLGLATASDAFEQQRAKTGACAELVERRLLRRH